MVKISTIYFFGALIAAVLYAFSARAEEREFRFPTQSSAAARYLSRWIQRLEQRLSDAYNDGLISAEKYEELVTKTNKVRTLARQALADGVVTGGERWAIRRAIGEIDMVVAETRFGPAKPVPERWTTRDPLQPLRHPRPPPVASGTESAR